MNKTILILSVLFSFNAFANSCNSPVKSSQILDLVEYAVSEVFQQNFESYQHPTVCMYSDDYDSTKIDAKTTVTYVENGMTLTDSCMVQVYTLERNRSHWVWSIRRIDCESGRRSSFYFTSVEDLEGITGQSIDGDVDDYYDN